MGRLFWIAVVVLVGGLIVLVMTNSSGEVLGLDTDSFGNLVYLGALGALVASGILASGQRFGQTVRTLAMWLLVILVFMAGYEYRYELQDVASRVSGGHHPRQPAVRSPTATGAPSSRCGSGWTGISRPMST